MPIVLITNSCVSLSDTKMSGYRSGVKVLNKFVNSYMWHYYTLFITVDEIQDLIAYYHFIQYVGVNGNFQWIDYRVQATLRAFNVQQ